MDGQHPLRNTHVKLLASDLLSLSQTLSPGGASVSRTQAVGTVIYRYLKPDKFVKFALDDGTAIVVCVPWLNHLTSPYFSRLSPCDLRLAADAAALGSVTRVRGRLAAYRGQTPTSSPRPTPIPRLSIGSTVHHHALPPKP